MKRMFLPMMLIALMGLVASIVIAQQAGPGPRANRFGENLTEEQRTQLHAKMKEMREAGAKPEEVRAAMAEMLKGWGIEPPQGRGAGEGRGNRFGDQLTEEQRAQLHKKMQEMRAAGATQEEIQAARIEMLKGFGIEAQARPAGQGPGAADGPRPRFANLTEEQRTQVQAKMREMRQAGAKPEEIKAAIQEMLKGWGVEPQGKGQGAGRFANLTEEQRTQLQAKIKEMRDAGAKPEEIRAAVQEMCKGWGVELQGRGGGQGPGMQGMFQDLSDTERQQVLTKMDEMKKAGAPREEIRRTIMEMIKGFGDKA